MDNILFAVWVKDRLAFSDKERRECFETAHTIVNIAQEVRKNGLLSIDRKISAMDDTFLQRALQLAVDSFDPETIEKLMQTWIIYGNYSSAELLKRIIITEGVTGIVKGENPKFLMEKLSAFFGEDLYDEYNGLKTDEAKDVLTEYYNTLTDVLVESFCELDKIIVGMDNTAIQILSRNLEEHTLVFAFKGLAKQAVKNFLDNMSARTAQNIAERCMDFRAARVRDVTAAQDNILEKIKELEKRGEIIISKDK